MSTQAPPYYLAIVVLPSRIAPGQAMPSRQSRLTALPGPLMLHPTALFSPQPIECRRYRSPQQAAATSSQQPGVNVFAAHNPDGCNFAAGRSRQRNPQPHWAPPGTPRLVGERCKAAAAAPPPSKLLAAADCGSLPPAVAKLTLTAAALTTRSTATTLALPCQGVAKAAAAAPCRH